MCPLTKNKVQMPNLSKEERNGPSSIKQKPSTYNSRNGHAVFTLRVKHTHLHPSLKDKARRYITR